MVVVALWEFKKDFRTNYNKIWLLLDSGFDHRHHKDKKQKIKQKVGFALILGIKYSCDVSLRPALVRLSVFISSVCRPLSL